MGEMKETLPYFFHLFAVLKRRKCSYYSLADISPKCLVGFLPDRALMPSHMGVDLSSTQFALPVLF